MIPYSIQLVPKSATGRRPQIAMIPQYLTIHSTANTATAQNERDNIANNNPNLQVSFHIVVDDKGAIECIPLNEVAWHAGDGRGQGNMASISLEICEGGDREKTLRNAIILAAHLLKQYGWGIDRMRQHWTWSKKNCPRILRDTGRWNWFLLEIQKELKIVDGNMLGDVAEPEMIYNYVDENMPEWARESVQWAVDSGIVRGDGNGLNLDDRDLQYLVWLHRTFLLKK